MKQAVVIHPRLTIYGGAEIIALHIIKTLQELDFEVSIVTDNYNPAEIERNYRMGKVLENTKPILVPPFKPVVSRFLALQHLRYSERVMRVLRGLQPDIAFSHLAIDLRNDSHRLLECGCKPFDSLRSALPSPYCGDDRDDAGYKGG